MSKKLYPFNMLILLFGLKKSPEIDKTNKQDKQNIQNIVDIKKYSPDFIMKSLIDSSLFFNAIAYVNDKTAKVAHNNTKVKANMK